MVWGLAVAAFWIVSVIVFLWILSKPRLSKRYGIFSIVFASVMLGVIAAALIFLAYIAIILFVIFLILFFVIALATLVLKKI